MSLGRLIARMAPLLAAVFALGAIAQGIVGTWREPTGSVIQIDSCGHDLCARLIAISKSAPTDVDINNPDPTKRATPLCGLLIGRGFQPTDTAHAEGGFLYDPKSGKTYRGSMKADGDRLELRGYVGVKLFGRSEIWQRTPQPSPPCGTTR